MGGLRLIFVQEGEERAVRLGANEVRIGRGSDNDIVLSDFSVSRRHAVVRREGNEWFIHDLGSTNGVLLNRVPVSRERLRLGDQLKVGVFDLWVGAEPEVVKSSGEFSSIPNATIVRRLSDFSTELGLDAVAHGVEPPMDPLPASSTTVKGGVLQYFRFLNRLARDLIHADSTEEVLERALEIAFEALPVDRGFILMGEHADNAVCELARVGDVVTHHPAESVPVSRTILRTVLEDEVALLTLDALDDQRLLGGESIRIHGIRAAMCAPLWSTNQIIGFIQVDTPFHTGSFDADHLDFLITLANYVAVGVQRLHERRLRSRFERYHSPAVIEEVLRQERAAPGGGKRDLRKAEVTVLFADLVGFTAFAESSSLDEVAELLSGYCARAVAAIFDQGGTLDKYIGDCVMAFFGAPMRHDDHAERGVRAAIRVLDALDVWNTERRHAGLDELRCRIAINSGPVVVGDIGSAERVDYTVLGNTVNIAARLESSIAQPGQIVLGDATRALLPEGRFRLEPLGAQVLRGLQQQIVAHRVVRDAELETRQVRPAGGG
jgi:adenylate cyclase